MWRAGRPVARARLRPAPLHDRLGPRAGHLPAGQGLGVLAPGPQHRRQPAHLRPVPPVGLRGLRGPGPVHPDQDAAPSRLLPSARGARGTHRGAGTDGRSRMGAAPRGPGRGGGHALARRPRLGACAGAATSGWRRPGFSRSVSPPRSTCRGASTGSMAGPAPERASHASPPWHQPHESADIINTSSKCQRQREKRIPLTRLRQISAANIGPKRCHQNRTVSWLT